MEKQVHFIPFNIEDKFPFRLEFIEKTVFKNTYFQITYLKFKGRINTPDEQQLLSYFIEKNLDENAKAVCRILDFTELIFNTIPNIREEVIISLQKVFSNPFTSKLDAINFLIEKNIKKFPNASYKHYEQLPKMEKLERDSQLSKVTIETFLSENDTIGILKLIGIYPYKGSLEANYIQNNIDIFVELTPIQALIVDITDFSLEYDWDNDLCDLKPTHPKYHHIPIYYLDKEKRDFMSEHNNIILNLNEINGL